MKRSISILGVVTLSATAWLCAEAPPKTTAEDENRMLSAQIKMLEKNIATLQKENADLKKQLENSKSLATQLTKELMELKKQLAASAVAPAAGTPSTSPAVAASSQPSSAPAAVAAAGTENPFDTFRGIAWETDISKDPNFKLFKDKPDPWRAELHYVPSKEVESIGNLKVSFIMVTTFEGKLIRGIVWFDKSVGAKDVMSALAAKYGDSEYDKEEKCRVWKGKTSDGVAARVYLSAEDDGELKISYNHYGKVAKNWLKKQEELDAKKVKEAAGGL